MTTLPLDFPPLRAAAEEMAREFHTVDNDGCDLGPGSPTTVRVFMRLLADLTRPASLDFWSRWLARHHGLSVGATAPEWGRHSIYTEGPPRFYWALGGAHGKAFHDHGGIYWRMDYNPVCVPGINDVTYPASALRLACLAAVG